jgi:S-DNA-T family DNA segregation ATPase FtsK/SpoIIIE
MHRGVGEAFNGHGRDVAGVLVIVVGAVAGLGLYADLAGPVGRGLAAGLQAGLGVLAYAVPVVLVVGGALLLRRRSEDPPSSLRPVVGGALLLVAATGVLHLATGGPGIGGETTDLESSGGYVGAAVTSPLTGLFGTWAAALVLLAVGAIGAVVATNRTLHDAGVVAGGALRPAWDLIVRGWRAMFTLGDQPPADAGLPDAGLPDAGSPDAGSPDTVVPVVSGGTVVNVPGDDDLTPAWLKPGVADAGTTGGEPADGVDAGCAVVVAADVADAPQWLADAATDATTTDAEDDEVGAGPPEQLTIDLGPAVVATPWKLPKPTLLDRSDRHVVDTADVERRGRMLEQALADHGVDTRLVGMVVGPTVTRFELELGAGVKVARVTSLNRDIAYAMASPDVRILAPIPGRQAIGVEVPNVDRQVISLGDVLSSEEAHRASQPLEVALGRDINGKNILVDLATMPHLLIAGQTGAGKSSCINSLITSVLMRTTPEQVRMILIDPKRVELGQYNRLPHLLTQVVTNPKKAANALSWAVREMERRYDLLSETGFRDIGGYNSAYDRGELNDPEADESTLQFQRLPLLLVVVDELNDLMMVAARDVEDSICRIAQMARAVGIHLVVATQRPSVNVITGVIKANIPSRLAFAVSSLADSRVILDQPGAERLVGKGDMLLVGASSSIAQRIQGCWVSEREVRAVVGHWRRQAPDLTFDDAAVQGTDDSPGAGGGGGAGAGGDDDDELLVQATELVVRTQLGSTSMLQRKLRVGFARAGRLMDLLEQRGVVGPSEGSKARAVLMTPDELDAGTTEAWSDEAIGTEPGSGEDAADL